MKKEEKIKHITIVSNILATHENLSIEQRESLQAIIKELEKENGEIDYLQIVAAIVEVIEVGIELYDKFKT